ncbi:MAG: DUF2652 domain-containing protein [Armatimonadota bacterium]
MLSRAERACLVIADISGYTGYLTGSELEHAQDVLADLFETVVGGLRPVLRLAKLEGDAAFVYALEAKIDGSMLLDTVEGCYFAFQRRLRSIRQATTCECNACVLIPNLNLKFVIHHGEFVRQRIAGREELAGTDVIVVHRLLKNSVAEKFTLNGYALFSAACIAAMGIDVGALGMREHHENYEHIGDVMMYMHDLEARWMHEREHRRVTVEPDNVETSFDVSLPAPPPVAWENLTDPQKRVLWQVGTDRVDQTNVGGRRGVGTTNHCVHGHGVIVEEILDWRPFDYYTIQANVPGFGPMRYTFEFTPTDPGTSMHMRVEKFRNRKQQELWKVMREQFASQMGAWFARLVELLGEEMASREPDTTAISKHELHTHQESSPHPAPPHAH